jgi:hypothetical protein
VGICSKSNVEKSKDDISFQDGRRMCRKSNIEKRKKLIKKQRRHFSQHGGWMCRKSNIEKRKK